MIRKNIENEVGRVQINGVEASPSLTNNLKLDTKLKKFWISNEPEEGRTIPGEMEERTSALGGYAGTFIK